MIRKGNNVCKDIDLEKKKTHIKIAPFMDDLDFDL